jgi:hypothetical protein
LAVDAIDLAISERPQVVVIASSDSDFAPLVARLREKGCRVVGVGQHGKTGDETIGVYDDYEVLAHRKTTTTRAPAARKTPVARKAPARKVAPPPLPDKARAILEALPELSAGKTVELRVAAERLREAKLLTRSGSSTKLFGEFADLFELLPAKQPNHVKRRGA